VLGTLRDPVAPNKGRAKPIRNHLDRRGYSWQLAFVLFGDVFVGRISEQGLQDESRMAVYNITIGSILVCRGRASAMATFQDVFPLYRDRSISVQGRWTMAHSTYWRFFRAGGDLWVDAAAQRRLLVFQNMKGGVGQASQRHGALCGGGNALFPDCLHSVVDFSPADSGHRSDLCCFFWGAGVGQSFSSRVFGEWTSVPIINFEVCSRA